MYNIVIRNNGDWEIKIYENGKLYSIHHELTRRSAITKAKSLAFYFKSGITVEK